MTDKKEWENVPTTKVTTNIETVVYQEIKSKFHFGQMTALLRNFLYAILIMIRNDQMVEITKFIHKESGLNLPKLED